MAIIRMRKCVADETCIVNVSGLRMVTKATHGGWQEIPDKYSITLTFKGKEQSIAYTTVEARDAMYTAIREAMMDTTRYPNGGAR